MSAGIDTRERRGGLFAPSQLSAKTVLTACATAAAFALVVYIVWHAHLALALTVAAALIAIALDHGVARLQRRGLRRGWAIALVMGAVLLALAGLGLLLVPPAVDQGRQLAMHLPELAGRLQDTRLYGWLDRNVALGAALGHVRERLLGNVADIAHRSLALVGRLVEAVGAVVTIFFAALFMLLYGGRLVERALSETTANRVHYERVLGNMYRALGGYIGGLGFLSLTHASAITIFLAILGVPFFLPLGIFSGLFSLIPIFGATLAGLLLTVIVYVTGGLTPALATVGFYVVFQQLENHVLGPLVYRHTVQVNPLLSLLTVLFFVELGGIGGALVAVPTLSTLQIVLHELLAMRRARSTPLAESPSAAPPSTAQEQEEEPHASGPVH